MICATLRVSGTVQGVGYRAHAIRCAGLLGVTGTVRNCQDGSVEIECECESGKQLWDFKRMLMRKEKFGIDVSGIETMEQKERASGRKFGGFGAIG